jgi:D-alanyl-D-alanine carboxypeptidase
MKRPVFSPAALLAVALIGVPAVAQAQLCEAAQASMSSADRVYGHLSYGDAPPTDLVPAPAGFALGACLIRRDMIADLERLLAAAPAGSLRGLSCHRSIIRQADVFCRERPAGGAADRSISVAPPGHSEHSTGYVIDFAVRPRTDCPDAEACMAATAAARWLVANAPRYGFEMSFPGGNRQNVKWEPWHWRWVGVTAATPGAARARFVFAKARRDFPATPAVVDTYALNKVPAPPTFVAAPTWTGKKQRKRRR